MKVIIRSSAIANEVEPSGQLKIAAAPDNGRANEPWQWRLTVGDDPVGESTAGGQRLTFHDPTTGRERTLELACDENLVSGAMRSETIDSQLELRRAEGELVVVYMYSGELAVDQHSLGHGDAAIISGSEHHTVNATPVAGPAGFALIRLGSLADKGLVWIP